MYSQNRNALMAQKPEYVLKRANDLINSAIGNNADKEKRMALEQLHAHISSRGKKSSMWSKIYETLMKRHLELCVDLKDDRTAKDGLHQYRNLCQAVDPASLELVVVHLMDLAEMKALAARTKADKVALAAAAKVSDLDQEETPESIMLSSMTEEGDRDRTDREVVVPWLKFLWEIYRAILDLLQKNAKLERVYHKTCEKAFNFCKDFSRTLEFRRLCEMLRIHLVSLQKVSSAPMRVTRQPWEWTPEGVEMHLQTRFAQLEVATSLELWNEGFRTVEDIYAIMQIGGKKSKPRVMASYYEKLTRIFLVSDNYLFHAYTWYRYYCLTVDSKKDLPVAERKVMASCVLLSALCIPSVKEIGIMDPNTIPAILDDEEIAHEKNQRMAMLLDFQANPTRHALLQDIVSKGILADVLPGVAELYTNIESTFSPLTLAKNIVESLAIVKSTPQLAHYAVPLQRVVVLRVVLQLSRVYSSVKVDFVRKLLAPLSDIPYNQVERVMVDGVTRKQLQLRIDHAAGCLRFGSLVTSSSMVESQVSQFGYNISKIAETASQSNNSSQAASKIASRKAYMSLVAEAVESEHAALIERRRIIELRKEGLERLHAIVAEKTRISLEEQEARRKVAENKRLEEEAKQREEDNRRKAEEKLSLLKLQKDLLRYNIIMDETELAGLDAVARLGLIRDAKAKEQSAKDDAGRRVNEQAKKLDHITRAVRIEAAQVISVKYAETVEQDRIAHEADLERAERQRVAQHALELVEKARLARMQTCRSFFEEPLIKAQREAFVKAEAKKLEKAVLDMRQKRIARARQRYSDELEREREEREMEQDRRERDERERERIEQETANALRMQREADEAAERAIFDAAQKAKRDEERAARLASTTPAAAGPEAEGPSRDGGSGWQTQRTREGAAGPRAAPSAGGWNSNARGERDSGRDRDSAPAPAEGGRWGSLGGARRDEGPSVVRREGGGFGDRSERPGFGDRSERPGLGDRSERPGFGDRSERPGFGDRSERPGFGDRSERPRDGPSFGARSDRDRGGDRGEPDWSKVRGSGRAGDDAKPRQSSTSEEPSNWRTKK